MYLGIDLGTSGVKTILMDEEQKVLASKNAPLNVSRPQPGWSEQDPAEWWAATQQTLDALAADHPGQMTSVKGIGLSGHMHGATLIDSEDKVLRPCILWNDGRSDEQCAALERAEPALRTIAGNIAMAGFTAPKLAWVRRFEPEVFDRTAKVLLPKDYLRLCLTGEYVSDMSDSAGTLWLDVAARDWSEGLLEATGLTREHMPRLVEGSEPSATLKADLAKRWGMASPPVVAGGGGDNAASACGVGTIAPGSAFLSLGTSGVLFASNDRFSPNTANAVHAFCHAVPQVWHQMGVILSATDCLEWLSRVTGSSAKELSAQVTEQDLKATSLYFMPYLGGERTPHNDVSVRASFSGLDHGTDRATLTQAVFEGVAFAFRDCLEALSAAGTEVSRATAVGGGSRSRAWLTIAASVLDIEIDIPAEGDFGAALGAARLGVCAATGADPTEICAPPPMTGSISPNPDLRDAYRESYGKYRALYPAVTKALAS